MQRALELASSERSESRLKNVLSSSWSPVKMLTKEEHVKILSEKLLRVDAEVAILDEEIASLQKQQSERESALGRVAEGNMKGIST
jgi:hypothetical protein